VAVVQRDPEVQREPERAVFVSEDGRRARRLRRVAVVATVLACLWVVGLVVGMVGFGSLPGVALVKGLRHGQDPAEPTPAAAVVERAARISRVSIAALQRPTGATRRVLEGARSPARTAAAAAKSRKKTASRSSPVAGGTPIQPTNPAGRVRGWSRKGQPAPPGQTRRVTPPPPPQMRGRRRGQTTPTTPPPPPPGQVKKAQKPPPPPPPPPPPSKKG
jgi:hypothetical protein